jgi:hypothetical protein
VTWFLMLLALAQAPSALDLAADAQPTRQRAGQVIELRVIATWPTTVSDVSPRLEAWTGPFEVVHVDAGATNSLPGGRNSRIWVLRVRTFELGAVTIPGIRFGFRQAGLQEQQFARTNDFGVESVVPNLKLGGTVRPLKDVIQPARGVAEYAVLSAVVGLVALAAAWLLGWLIAFARRPARARAFNLNQALRELERSRRRNSTNIEAFCSDVSAMARRFVEATFSIPGAVLSSTEIVAAARKVTGPGLPVQRLSDLLTAVDAVRFGGWIPSDSEIREIFEQTKLVLSSQALLTNVAPPQQSSPDRVGVE